MGKSSGGAVPADVIPVIGGTPSRTVAVRDSPAAARNLRGAIACARRASLRQTLRSTTAHDLKTGLTTFLLSAERVPIYVLLFRRPSQETVRRRATLSGGPPPTSALAIRLGGDSGGRRERSAGPPALSVRGVTKRLQAAATHIGSRYFIQRELRFAPRGARDGSPNGPKVGTLLSLASRKSPSAKAGRMAVIGPNADAAANRKT